MFSKACEYAIKAVIFIAGESKAGRRVSLKGIARATDSPVAFTAKILQKLAREGVVESSKGPTGGFKIGADKRKEVKLSAIVSAIDGDSIYRGCALGLPECSAENPCPVHDRFVNIRDELQEMLENTSVEELTVELLNGLVFLKR